MTTEYTTIAAPTISGFYPIYGLPGSAITVSGDNMEDVTGLSFIDAQGQKTNLEFGETPIGGESPDYYLTGVVPSVEISKIEKFPKFTVEASNALGSGTLCCYEIQNPSGYRVHGDLTIASGLCVEGVVPNTSLTNLLVTDSVGAGCLYTRPMNTIVAALADSSNYSDIANLAMSVQIGWHEFTEEFETSLRIPEDGTATKDHGLRIASMKVTPARDDSYLLIDADLSVSAGSVTEVAAMLFKDDEEHPQKIWKTWIHLKNLGSTLRLRHIEPINNPAVEQTWSINFGVGMYASHKLKTAMVNKVWDNQNIYGDKATSVLWCREMKSGALNALISGAQGQGGGGL